MNPLTTTLEVVPSLEDFLTDRPAHAQATEWVADALRRAMDAGALVPGSKLAEEHLAGTLDVSRNTLRQAFTILEGQNLVERIPNRGVFVVSPAGEQIREMFITRWAIQSAALDYTPAGPIGGARAALEEAQAAEARGSVAGMAGANQAFHRALVAAAGSERLNRAMASVLAEMRLLFFSQVTVPGFHAPYVGRNRELLELVEAGQREQARAFLWAYLEGSRAYFMQGAQGQAGGQVTL